MIECLRIQGDEGVDGGVKCFDARDEGRYHCLAGREACEEGIVDAVDCCFAGVEGFRVESRGYGSRGEEVEERWMRIVVNAGG